MHVIIDYGMGNLLSVLKAFRRLNIPAKISSAASDVGGRGNVMGVQFHPEKIHDDGMMILKNFFGLTAGRSRNIAARNSTG